MTFDVTPNGSHREARRELESSGWTLIGEGHWSWAYRSPDGARVARVSPWDPAYLLYAEQCQLHPRNRYMQRVEAVIPLFARGHVVLMEYLLAPDDSDARALCAALGLRSDSDEQWTDATAVTNAGDVDLVELRSILQKLNNHGRAVVPYWGGLDIRPGNVLATSAGQPKLVDPLFVSGPKLRAALHNDASNVLALIPRDELEQFLEIPFISSQPELAMDLTTLIRGA